LKKTTKLTITIVLSLLAIYVSAYVYEIIKEHFLRQAPANETNSQIVNEAPDWKTYRSPDNSFSIESPFFIRWQTKEKIANGKGYRIIQGISFSRSGFLVSIDSTTWYSYKKSTLDYFEKRGLDSLKEIDKNEPNFKWKDQPVTCSSIPATLANCSFTQYGISMFSSDLFVNKNNQTLAIGVSAHQISSNTFNAWSKRVFGSIKIEPKIQ
jgi:hypothetical protein